jgi:lipoprotein-anchoring transpeptidase ErfK/SrfK
VGGLTAITVAPTFPAPAQRGEDDSAPVTAASLLRYLQARLIKGAVLVALIAASLDTQVGAANTVFFYARSAQLEISWLAAEAAGVPSAGLEPSRSALRAQDRRWVGTLPYAAVSGAAFRDPFADLEKQARTVGERAGNDARSRAEAALLRLREAGGPNDRTYYDGLVQLGGARQPRDYERLATAWNGQAARKKVVRDRLAASSGGLSDGLPGDVVQGMTRLRGLAAVADQAGVSSDPAWQVSAEGQLYLAGAYPQLLDRHPAMIALLISAITTIEKRVNARETARSAVARIPDLLPQALRYGIGNEYSGQADQVRNSLAQARTDGELVKVADVADALARDLEAAKQGRLPLRGIACLADAPAKQIVLHLKTQQLVAYENGCPVLRTPITTGRPALRTQRGTFHIFLKARSWHMVSQWPKESRFYYSPTWVYNAMEFIADGTFIHNADWQPDSSYGPGSENGPYSSHGCVHVIDGPLAQLYDWAPIGTTVVVGD